MALLEFVGECRSIDQANETRLIYQTVPSKERVLGLRVKIV